MQAGTRLLDVGVNSVTLAIVFAVTLPAIGQIPKLLRKPHSAQDGSPQLYQDNDGVATEGSSKAYFDLVPRLAAAASLVLGLLSSIASALLYSHEDSASATASLEVVAPWLTVATWALICLQWASLPWKGNYGQRFNVAVGALFSSLFVGVCVGGLHGYAAIHDLMGQTNRRLLGAATLLQFFAAIGAICAFGAFPRRPDVYFKGELVDQQYTVSLLSWLSFSWNQIVFQISRRRQLQLADIPKLGFQARSRTLHENFLAKKIEGRLWWRLLRAHTRELAEQWVLTFIIACLSLFPEVVLYNFLGRIETRRDYTTADPALFVWIFGLFLSIVLQVGFGNWQGWVTTSRLEIPVASMLQSLVFRKALGQYETTRPPQKEDDEPKEELNNKSGGKADKDDMNGKTAQNGKSTKKDNKDKKDKKDKADASDVQQSVINHMKLDSSRVTMFCSFNNSLPSALFKLGLAGAFLIRLLGWKSFFAGLFSAALMIPLSTWMGRKFRDIQFGLMRYRDGKAHVLEEALAGMRQIKYSALEQHWQDKILKKRNEELAQFWKASVFMCFLMVAVNLGPFLLACVSLSIYVWENPTDVRASVIFTSLGLLNQVDEAVSLLPILQTFMMEAWTSCTRLEKYLSTPDKPQAVSSGESITMESATVAWPKVQDPDAKADEPDEARSMLRDLNLAFPTGKLSVVTGKTGSGKSLLLAAILGEVKVISGRIYFPSAPEMPIMEEGEEISQAEWIIPSLSSFVSQTPWIEGGTFKENIMFGLPFSDSRYRQVVGACALEKDIELLVEGDQTEVGPKGVTLSGGQRWRLALARALYSRAGIIILDDVLSAVDAHVGRRIVDEALTGPLAHGRTRILATHHAELVLPHASYLVRLHSGRLESAKSLQPTEATDLATGSGADEEVVATNGSANHSSEASTAVGLVEENGKVAKEDSKEKREVGRVKWRVYKVYLGASGGILLWALGIGIMITVQLTGVARTWTLKEMTETGASAGSMSRPALSLFQSPEHYHDTLAPNSTLDGPPEASQHSVGFWMAMYVGFYVLSLLIQVGRTLAFFTIGLTAAKVFFERMVYAILRAPLRWVDTVPAGRILNRCTTDTFTLDRRTVEPLAAVLRSIFSMIIVIGASLSVSGYVILFGVLLSFFYAYIANRFISAAREVKRINSVCHSPIYDQFSSVLNGLSTIRAYHRTEYYMDRMFGMIDDATKASWALSLCNLWMRFRMGMLGAFFVTAVATAVALGRVDAGLAGFSLTFAFNYTWSLTALLSALTSMELGFNAAERILEYAEIETEPQDGKLAPAAWPTEGRIEIDDLTVAYSKNLPAVLKNLTFTVQPGERVGIVGRTGAGKSTLASVLFRLLEPRSGSVSIDGLDISTLKLSQLRSRLAIIPQDPFLFSGTLRSNLDMQGILDDYDIQIALQRVRLVEPQSDPERPSTYLPAQQTAPGAETQPAQLSSEIATDDSNDDAATAKTPLLASSVDASHTNGAEGSTRESEEPDSVVAVHVAENHGEEEEEDDVKNIFTNLSTPINSGGANLSQGQRQLVCLARALLTRPKIVVLDEATSAVDRGTDVVIQASLREAFAAAGCTVLVIAHRLSTVADFDRLLVLEDGRVAEMGTPRELLERGMALDERRKGKMPAVVEDDGDDDDDSKGNGGSAVDDTADEGTAEPTAPPPAGDADEQFDGTGAFWGLVQKSAEKEKLLQMILGRMPVHQLLPER